MSLKDQVISEKGNGSPLTYKQGSLLFQLTGLKWWQPETMPAATTKQASLIIGAMMEFIKSHQGGREIVETIQIWFPDFDDESQIRFRGGHKKASGQGNATEEDQPEPEPQPQPEPKPNPQTKSQTSKPGIRNQKIKSAAKQPAAKPPISSSQQVPAKGQGLADIEFLINAGIQNIWMVGPAGCGKTTICQIVGERLEMPVTVIPCGAGTSATTFLGYKYPEREGTPFVHAFAQEGIIVLDEFTSLEAQVAQIVNGALANGELSSTIGTFQRHERCIIIATSNTFGHGADRMYVSNNQLDASTIDRFAGGIVEIDYSIEYESQYDSEVCEYVWKLRSLINRNGLRKVASTRSIISACKLKEAGMNTESWKASITANWTKDEKALL